MTEELNFENVDGVLTKNTEICDVSIVEIKHMPVTGVPFLYIL